MKQLFQAGELVIIDSPVEDVFNGQVHTIINVKQDKYSPMIVYVVDGRPNLYYRQESLRKYYQSSDKSFLEIMQDLKQPVKK